MTSSNQKTAVRQLMAERGVNYTTALRQVADVKPSSSIRIGTAADGTAMSYNPVIDGNLLIIGGKDTGKSMLCRLIAAHGPDNTVLISAPERDNRFGRSAQNLAELATALEAARRTVGEIAFDLSDRLYGKKPAGAHELVIIDDADEFLDEEWFSGSEPGIITDRMESRNRSRSDLMLAVLDLLWLGRESNVTVVLATRTLGTKTRDKIAGALRTHSTRLLLDGASIGDRMKWLREVDVQNWDTDAGAGIVEYADGRSMALKTKQD